MREHSCLGDYSDCYNVAPVTIGSHATVSQYAYLCSASHDYSNPRFPLFARPIAMEYMTWVAARAYVGPGVTIHEGSVVGANACVYADVPSWVIVGGNPAKIIGHRRMNSVTPLHDAGALTEEPDSPEESGPRAR
jgi:putative colanic acid biosynthesis acetyltransferase WcaF